VIDGKQSFWFVRIRVYGGLLLPNEAIALLEPPISGVFGLVDLSSLCTGHIYDTPKIPERLGQEAMAYGVPVRVLAAH
jgi:hypothetical protein